MSTAFHMSTCHLVVVLLKQMFVCVWVVVNLRRSCFIWLMQIRKMLQCGSMSLPQASQSSSVDLQVECIIVGGYTSTSYKQRHG